MLMQNGGCEGGLDRIFTYADITSVEQTKHGVFIEATIRKTGAIVMVEGDDLDDASDMALRQIEDQVITLDNILQDYDLTIDDLRRLVDFNPHNAPFTPPVVNDEPKDEAPVGAAFIPDLDAIAVKPMQLVAAQSFVAFDPETDDMYVAFRLPSTPTEPDEQRTTSQYADDDRFADSDYYDYGY